MTAVARYIIDPREYGALISRVIRYFRHHIMSLVSIAIRGASVAIGFAVTYLIVHNLGAEANGHFVMITYTATFLSVVIAGGLDVAIVRDYSAAVARGQLVSRRNLGRVCLVSAGIAATICVAVVLFGNWMFAELTGPGTPELAVPLLILLFLLRASTRLIGAFLRSQRGYVIGQVIEFLFIPVGSFIAAIGLFGIGLTGILIATVAAGLAGTILGVVIALRKTSNDEDALSTSVSGLLKAALAIWGSMVIVALADWYSLAVVSRVLSVTDAGMYRAALQIASILPMISVSLFNVFSPQIGEALARNDYPRIARLNRSATLLGLVLVSPFCIAVFFGASAILGILGPDFAAQSLVLQIVIVGQFIQVASGPTGLTMAMTGHERTTLGLSIVSVIGLLVAVPFAASFWGLAGVAMCVALVLTFRSVARMIVVHRIIGINIFTGQYHGPIGKRVETAA